MEKSKIELGEEYRQIVKGIGQKGDPMVSIDGFVVFFKSNEVQIGDEVIIRVTRILEKVAFGELVEKV